MKISTNGIKKLSVLLLVAVAAATVSRFSSSSSAASAARFAGDGASVYKAKCAMCHAGDGSGNTPVGKSMKLRDLRSAEVRGQSDAALYAIIAKGKGKMPGFEKALGADTCKAEVDYIRQLK